MAIRRDEVPAVPRGTLVVVNEHTQTVRRLWRVDSMMQVSPDHHRVVVVPAVLSTGLVAYWTLNEASGIRHDYLGVHDLSDPTGVASEQGPNGLAAVFDRAAGKYLTTPMTDALNVGAVAPTGGSWSLWFKTTAKLIPGMILLGDLGGTNSGRLLSMSEAGTPRTTIFGTDHVDTPYFAGTFLLAETAVDCADGNWHLWVATYSETDGKVRLHIDGAAPIVTVTSWMPPRFAEVGEWRVGAGFVTPVTFFTGSIQHVGLWNRALTAEEILWLWNNGAGHSPVT